ncbi:Fanconi anemia group E protein isoform X2 [Brachyhypopomus gauderio]|uniref:Fanconi anemia group E protein isoform X2 n=1 Tax=Brachyhypopomus gauderio TaxID=698409 RepID=UPI004041E274
MIEQTRSLRNKPLVYMFSDAFKCDLLCFLHLLHPGVPQESVLTLLHCLAQDMNQKPWICALTAQLHRDIGTEDLGRGTLLTPRCVADLKGLCERFNDSQEGGVWDLYLNEHRSCGLTLDNEADSEHRKRKREVVSMDTERHELHSKRMKMDVSVGGPSESGKLTVDEEPSVETVQLVKHQEGDSAGTRPQPQDSSLCVLPDNIKAAVPLIKELLESGTEWDESSLPTLRVLNECDSYQLEMLCGILRLAETPEATLPQFCSSLLALSPDLSHSTACIIIRHLLFGKVLSLTEPASRCLVTAAVSLCGHYPRPTCQALIEPIIKAGQTDSSQAELLCRLVKECLEPHHRLLVFQMTLQVSWNEGLLSVIHALLDLKIELSEELFSLFTTQLSKQSPQFPKSMKFAKMMLTVLTKFQSYVNAACQHTLSCCISFNETFLKKSLQAALKRISQ